MGRNAGGLCGFKTFQAGITPDLADEYQDRSTQ
jgi:hypothetical protein